MHLTFSRENYMVSSKIQQLRDALKQHQKSLKYYESKEGDSDLKFLTLSKSFEVLVEYGWKFLKERVEDEGLDAPSPKEAVRKSAQIGLITNPKKWIDCINIRNDSVHHYFGISKKKFYQVTVEMSDLVQSLVDRELKK